jgi:hypothetical protein
MPAGIARLGIYRRLVFVGAVAVVVIIDRRRTVMVVRGRAVVVIGMIVPAVLVNVHGRRHGRRCDQGLNQHECQESAHEGSLLRVAVGHGSRTAATRRIHP